MAPREFEKEDCSVCCELIEDKKDAGFLNCGHYYHEDCIRQWSKNKSWKKTSHTCPLCRSKFHSIKTEKDNVVERAFKKIIVKLKSEREGDLESKNQDKAETERKRKRERERETHTKPQPQTQTQTQTQTQPQTQPQTKPTPQNSQIKDDSIKKRHINPIFILHPPQPVISPIFPFVQTTTETTCATLEELKNKLRVRSQTKPCAICKTASSANIDNYHDTCLQCGEWFHSLCLKSIGIDASNPNWNSSPCFKCAEAQLRALESVNPLLLL